MFLALACMLLAAEAKPLFYWGGRAPTIEMALVVRSANDPAIETVHLAREGAYLLIKISYDRPVSQALHLPDGTPVSGRLRAHLYVDCDATRTTGLTGANDDARVGSERLIELAVMALGADPEEHLSARALVTVGVYELLPGGERKSSWQVDEDTEPKAVAVHGQSVELRLPAAMCLCGPRARLVLAQAGEFGNGVFDAILAAGEDEGKRPQ
jgi:hypothetical protein